VYGEKLRKEGLTNTDKLLAACTTRYKRQQLAEKTGIPYKLVLAWAQKVELMKIHGVGPRGSNLLNAVFVRSVKDLAERNPENLAERVGIANSFKPKFLDNTPSQATVTKWIEAARALPKDISDDK
jgi:nucleotidyltransferase/DNA polymerase involved in DNA repair